MLIKSMVNIQLDEDSDQETKDLAYQAIYRYFEKADITEMINYGIPSLYGPITDEIDGKITGYICDLENKDWLLPSQWEESKRTHAFELLNLCATITIVHKVFSDRHLTSNQLSFVNSTDFKADVAKNSFICLSKRAQDLIFASFESFIARLQQGNLLFCHQALAAHRHAINNSIFTSFIPKIFGLDMYSKEFLESLTTEKSEAVTLDMLADKNGNLNIKLCEELFITENQSDLPRLPHLINIYKQDNYAEKLLNNIIEKDKTYIDLLVEIEKQADSLEYAKPSTILRRLINDPNIVLSKDPRIAALKEIIKEIKDRAIAQEEAVPPGRSWAVRSSSSAAAGANTGHSMILRDILGWIY